MFRAISGFFERIKKRKILKKIVRKKLRELSLTRENLKLDIALNERDILQGGEQND
jgi:hypothetical protein